MDEVHVDETADKKDAAGGVFRKKSVERISGPEGLNDYIRVTTPSVWLVLGALVLLVAGMLAWGIFGKVAAHEEDGSVRETAPITYVMN